MLVPSIGKPYAAIKGGITSERGVPAPQPADRRSYLCSAPAARLRIGPAGASVPNAGHHCPLPVRPVALRTSQARSFAAVVGPPPPAPPRRPRRQRPHPPPPPAPAPPG